MNKYFKKIPAKKLETDVNADNTDKPIPRKWLFI